jgi:hypothetical protein
MESSLDNLQLINDGIAYQGRIRGDDKAFVRVVLKEPGVVNVEDVFRGNLPKGNGSEFLAETLIGHGVIPTKQLIFSNIIEPNTIEVYKKGAEPSTSTLGKVGIKALQKLGLKSFNMKFEIYRGKLNLIINVEQE